MFIFFHQPAAAEQNILNIKNGIYLEVAEFSKLKPNYLNSVENSESAHLNRCFGYFLSRTDCVFVNRVLLRKQKFLKMNIGLRAELGKKVSFRPH